MCSETRERHSSVSDVNDSCGYEGSSESFIYDACTLISLSNLISVPPASKTNSSAKIDTSLGFFLPESKAKADLS